MLNARPTTRTSLQCLILSACVTVGLSLEARGQELLDFADNASMSGVASGSPLDRLPNILGDFFQSTGQQNATFRPEATAPATASGAGVGLGAGTSPVVLDAASNRFVYIDGSNNLLVPGNVGLGTEFVFFRAVGGGLLSETTNADGVTGFFGLERVSIDSTSGVQTVTSSVDILSGTTPATVTGPSQRHTVLGDSSQRNTIRCVRNNDNPIARQRWAAEDGIWPQSDSTRPLLLQLQLFRIRSSGQHGECQPVRAWFREDIYERSDVR